jgi:hypothetical protein
MRLNSKVLFLFILLGILFRVATLHAQGLCFDEARQFLIAKGVSVSACAKGEFRLMDTNVTNLYKVTLSSFLGSPCFTVLVHYWSKLSNAEPWLRVLPFLFSIGTLLIMYRLALACNFAKVSAMFFTAFCSWNGPWMFYSVELRPYSLEIFCVALTLLLFIRLIRHKGALVTDYVWLSLSMLVGIVSGYGYNIVCVLVIISTIFYIITIGDIGRKFIKISLIAIPVVVSLLYINHIIGFRGDPEIRSIDVALRITAEYLPYLSRSSHFGFGTYGVGIVNSVLSMMAWQLFYVGRIRYGFFNNAPIGLPFFLLAGIIFVCAVFLVVFLLKRKRYEEGAVLVILFGAVVICSILSTLQLFPMGPIRQNLFLSPALFMSFFILLKYLHRAAKRIKLRINWNYCALFIFIFMITLNMLRVNKSLAYGRNGEALRPLLKRIESSYHKGDKVCVYVNKRSSPSFIYEKQYSRFPWMIGLRQKDIYYMDYSFKAGIGSGYDYQWYLFIRDHEAANNVRNSLTKEGVILEEECTFLPEVIGFKARINSEKLR